jgi:DNA polymerase III subunit delta
MSENPPVVYLLHGEDEFAITRFVASLLAKLGDSAMADMNTVRLEGRSMTLEDLETAVKTLPFLIKRRLVIVSNPLARLTTQPIRIRFKKILDEIPPPVALVLIENRRLTEEKDRKKDKLHWLEVWANERRERVLLKAFPLPQGGGMIKRVQELVHSAEGQITYQAAGLLATLVGDNPRLASQEIEKLLAYVNYSRAIEIDDVESLIVDQGQGDVFAMVDAIGNRNGRKALDMLHRLLAEQEGLSIFGMVTRQFRLLLMTREFLDEGGNPKEASRVLKLHPWVAEKIVSQASRFTLIELEGIHHCLLDMDQAMKIGEMDSELALDSFIAQVTLQAEPGFVFTPIQK